MQSEVMRATNDEDSLCCAGWTTVTPIETPDHQISAKAERPVGRPLASAVCLSLALDRNLAQLDLSRGEPAARRQQTAACAGHRPAGGQHAAAAAGLGAAGAADGGG